jgi:hypothetical protein
MTSILLALLFFQAPAVDPAAILAEADSRKRVETIRQLLRKFDKSMISPMLRVGELRSLPWVRKFVVDR